MGMKKSAPKIERQAHQATVCGWAERAEGEVNVGTFMPRHHDVERDTRTKGNQKLLCPFQKKRSDLREAPKTKEMVRGIQPWG